MLARDGLPELGVVYPGSRRQHALAARAAIGNKGPRGDRPPTARDWDELIHEVAAAGSRQRVIVSSESFANATKEKAESVVAALGGESVHVLVTLRPLSKIMPSAWQQYVREGLGASYERWLKGMLVEAPYDKPTPTFWTRHAHDRLIQRWAEVVGVDRMTVIVVDGSDHGMLPRTVEQLLGLPTGTLKPEAGVANRSLTYGEIELVRALGGEFAAEGWSDEMFRAYVRQGSIVELQTTHQPSAAEIQIPTPSWALQRIGELGDESAAAIAALGVRVVGDLSVLGETHTSSDDVFDTPPLLTIDAACAAVIGAIRAGHEQGRRRKRRLRAQKRFRPGAADRLKARLRR
jgi:hypothetical protein